MGILNIFRFKIILKFLNYFIKKGKFKNKLNLIRYLKKKGLNIYFIIIFILKKLFIFIGTKFYKKSYDNNKAPFLITYKHILNLSFFFLFKILTIKNLKI